MKPNWLSRELLVAPVYFTLCINEKQFAKTLKHLGIKKEESPDFVLNWHSDATAHYFENAKTKQVSCVVCLRNFEGRDKVEIIGLLTHEAVHIWQQIKLYLGEKEPSAEFEAYSIQHLVMQLVSEFERQTA